MTKQMLDLLDLLIEIPLLAQLTLHSWQILAPC